jgi:uncharacterized membrane protein YccF (DUF307 family)
VKTIGNLIWFVLFGVWLGVAYLVAGVFSCLTIIGIPFGIQSFKLAGFVMWPFGRQLREGSGHRFSKGVLNVIWIVIGGLWLSLTHLLLGILACLTVVGIPFGLKNFAMARLALFPFDYSVVRTGSPGPNDAPVTSTEAD